MIRYDYDAKKFETSIRKVDKRWPEKAAKRTKTFVQNGAYSEANGIWSNIKSVFMDLQQNKCAFCERKFETKRNGKIEFDVDHFRPKAAVEVWPDSTRHPKLRYDFPTGSASSGYYWLAYDPQNYVVSCKICNSFNKSTYFPICGPRGTAPADFATLGAEMPLLCYPLAAIDTDPEELVSFIATTAIPTATSGYKRRRGTVLIDFFELNLREQLHRERAEVICVLHGAMKKLAKGSSSRHSSIVAGLTSPAQRHTNCARSFKRLWLRDQKTADRAAELCLALVAGIERAPPVI